ncbi:flagellin-like protein [Methanomicrobium sp. W14]|uniref:type IV pilin N-terminal domain-containing protein n=1 Tax=Methanomicrobium sp. W14 TaxID=2817839 RepID=UPI001AEB02DC|nr:type IV pilin N-terminal domain-containing protein [Methanomicrobium sp. W14]MBP2134028.1 flagellin-like protein [Methanomicrobium sp. W14]
MKVLKELKVNAGDEGVSPVVGVMLMLVVTIIIAAVVSGFAGGLVDTSQNAPTATVEISIKNGGDSSNSYFSLKVLGVSEPINTKDLKLVTSWVATSRGTGETISGGKSIVAGTGGNASIGESGLNIASYYVPTGYGAGVKGWANSTYHPPASQWGNYTLMAGTTMQDSPSDDYSDYGYNHVSNRNDAMQAILGSDWYNLKAGDTVNVRIIHVASGKAIVSQQVSVEE